MNERIQELAEQAGVYFGEAHKDYFGEKHPAFIDASRIDVKKFAELIVRECADITSGLSKLYPRTDVAFDVGYTMGTTRATKEIKEHFGVEE